MVNNKAYIFGGITADDRLASNDVHAITLEHTGQPETDYSLIPAIPSIEGKEVPDARAGHAACTFTEMSLSMAAATKRMSFLTKNHLSGYLARSGRPGNT